MCAVTPHDRLAEAVHQRCMMSVVEYMRTAGTDLEPTQPGSSYDPSSDDVPDRSAASFDLSCEDLPDLQPYLCNEGQSSSTAAFLHSVNALGLRDHCQPAQCVCD